MFFLSLIGLVLQNVTVSVTTDSMIAITDSMIAIVDDITDRSHAIFLIISSLNGLLTNRKMIGILPRRAVANRKINNLAPQGSS